MKANLPDKLNIFSQHSFDYLSMSDIINYWYDKKYDL